MTTETTMTQSVLGRRLARDTAPASDVRWYVVHTYSGREDKACEDLKQRVETFDVGNYIFDAVVPKQRVVTVTSDGGQKEEDQTMYRGYLLVRMKMPSSHDFVAGALSRRSAGGRVDEEAKYALDVLRNTTGIINFISVEDDRDGTRRPIALTDAEAHAMIMGSGEGDPQINFGFEKGDVVTITDGPFDEFSGTVDEVLFDKGIVRVTVSFFGQDTPVELPFNSVEKA